MALYDISEIEGCYGCWLDGRLVELTRQGKCPLGFHDSVEACRVKRIMLFKRIEMPRASYPRPMASSSVGYTPDGAKIELTTLPKEK